MIWLNVGCGTHRAPPPWINVDVVRRDDVQPDLIVQPGDPLPYDCASVEKIYAGHVLEHMPWPDTLAYLHDLRRVLEPGGELLVTGPDVLRTLARWKRDLEPEFMLHTVLEYHDRNPGFETSDWPGARHWWNCWSARVADVVEQAGFREVTELDPPDQVIESGWMAPWPNVAAAPWWCAVHALA